ncbi:MAG: flagellar export protein FliJ [Candidatus Hinthialibacter antarcticus]|nr:flagellar export protein FliJ [Candidatus Hinthialibacter antarcticus]
MKNFHFRLDPVMRLKRYQIEEKEQEIQRLEDQVLDLLQAIEDGRASVQAFRQRLLEQSSDSEYTQKQKTLDQFRAYINKVEQEKQAQIERLRTEQNERRQELIGLYQEEKILEKLREKKHTDWQAETIREEDKAMDEIGAQRFNRRDYEHGGILLYLLVPILLIGAAAGIGWYTGVIDQEMLQKIPLPFFQGGVASATDEVQAATSTAVADAYTVEDLLGDIDKPMPDLLDNIIDVREQQRRKEEDLARREDEIKKKEASLLALQNSLSGYVDSASEQLETLQDLRRKREEEEKSELSELEQKMSAALAKAKPKEISNLIISLYQANNVVDEDEKREQQLRAVRLIRSMPDKSLSTLFAQFQKDNPLVASQMMDDYLSLTTEELYGIEPSPTEIPSATSAAQSN